MRHAGLILFLSWMTLCSRAADIPAADTKGVASACRRARPGDSIVLADGVWRDADIVFRATGAPDAPITLRPRHPGGAVLSGHSRLRIAGEHLVVSGLVFRDGWAKDDAIAFRADSKTPASNCRLTGCAIFHYNPPPATAVGESSHWLSLYGTSNRVDHCVFSGKRDAGTTLVVWVGDAPNGHRIDHNLFGPRPPLGRNGGETIRVGTSDVSMRDSGTIVEENYFERCDGEVEIISNKSCGNTYRHNAFVACSGTLTLRHGNRCSVYGNWFLGNRQRGTGGIRIIGEDHRVFNNYMAGLEGDGTRSAISFQLGVPDSPLNGYFQAKRATVAFNTIVDCKSPLVIGAGDEDEDNPSKLLAPADCTVANNLIACRKDRPPIAHMDPRSRIRFAGNLVSGAPDALSLPDGARATEIPMRASPGGVARPTPNGPTRAAATDDAPFVADDIDGQPRDGGRDVGCDQASDAPAPHRPLTTDDVGPVWISWRTFTAQAREYPPRQR